MSEPWKVIICEETDCLSQALASDGSIREGFKIYPEVDTEERTSFRCSRCGHVENWSHLREQIAKTLYEKLEN